MESRLSFTHFVSVACVATLLATSSFAVEAESATTVKKKAPAVKKKATRQAAKKSAPAKSSDSSKPAKPAAPIIAPAAPVTPPAAAIAVETTAKAAESVAAREVKFDIGKFEVQGNTLLPPARIDELVAPFTGKDKNYADVQRALEALDNEYRRQNYGTVSVIVPEQELAGGTVVLKVTEGVIGKVAITGNQYFDADNIRASLPDLKEGGVPNLRKLSENTQLVNESPAKKVEVTLGVSEEAGKINARVDVAEQNPQRFYLTLDNTGTNDSGKNKIGVAYQHANLFNRDQIVTLAYTTAIDAPGGIDSEVYSIGYRLPLYALGDSIDFIYGVSNTNIPSVTPNLTNPLAINGQGKIIGLRYNHMFARSGLYTSKLVAGYDYKYFDNTCDIGGVRTPKGVAGCTPCNRCR